MASDANTPRSHMVKRRGANDVAMICSIERTRKTGRSGSIERTTSRTSRSDGAGKAEAEFGAGLAVGHIYMGTHGVG